MKFLVVLGAFCLFASLEARSQSRFSNVVSYKTIDDSAHLGDFLNIGSDVSIKANVRVGSHSSINAFTSIAENSEIGNHVNIGAQNTIEVGAIVASHVSTGKDVQIGARSVLNNYSSIGNYVKMGQRVIIYEYASVSDNARIEDDSILDRHSSVNRYAEIRPKAYVGSHSSIGANTLVNEFAVIHDHVEIPSEAVIKTKEVVIRSPSSQHLYQNIEALENLSDAQIKIASTGSQSGIISSQFNVYLRGLLYPVLSDLQNCNQINIRYLSETLRLLRTMYLIQLHGLANFTKNQRDAGPNQITGNRNFNIINGDLFVNGVRLSEDKLQNEYHFDENAQINILEPIVKKAFIQLLAIEQDVARKNRVENDTVCLMISEIIKDEREVSCARSSGTNIVFGRGNFNFGPNGGRTYNF